jgi:hypothetical protein
MQSGGDLVETVSGGGRVLWKSGTSGAGAYAVLQDNGDLVVHAVNGDVLWTNDVAGTGCPSLDVQEDGNVVDYDPAKAIWSSGSNYQLRDGDKLQAGQRLYADNREYELYLHPTGDLSLYNDANQQIWDTNTAGNPGDYLEMMPSGNVDVWSSAGTRLWQSSTAGNTGAHAYVASNGNFEVDSSAAKELWVSKSTGHAGTGAHFSATGPAGSATPCPAPPPPPTTATVTVPTTTTVTNTVTTVQVSTVVEQPPVKAGALHVKIGLDWHWNGDVTRLRGLKIESAFPRGSVLSGVYQPPHGRRHLLRAGTAHEVAHLLHWAQEIVYHPRDLFELTVVRRGDREEKLQFTIRAGALPKCEPACVIGGRRP